MEVGIGVLVGFSGSVLISSEADAAVISVEASTDSAVIVLLSSPEVEELLGRPSSERMQP